LAWQGEGWVKKLDVDRKCRLTSEEFVRDHMSGNGLPVVVTDAMDAWPALSKWTFDYFMSKYGSDFVMAPLGLRGDISRLTKLSGYLDYLKTPDSELPGFWVRTRDGKPTKFSPSTMSPPPYLLGWHAFRRHPELFDDIRPAPYFVQDWVESISPPLRELLESTSKRDFWSVFVGSSGSLSELHRDFWHTHACLAQVLGRKRAILFPPSDTTLLYGGGFDPDAPDFERYPLLEQVTAYECVIGPGDVLFIPADWWHWVKGMESSITVTHNFFNNSNFDRYLTKLVEAMKHTVD
jgi:hypothetical protein